MTIEEKKSFLKAITDLARKTAPEKTVAWVSGGKMKTRLSDLYLWKTTHRQNAH